MNEATATDPIELLLGAQEQRVARDGGRGEHHRAEVVLRDLVVTVAGPEHDGHALFVRKVETRRRRDRRRGKRMTNAAHPGTIISLPVRSSSAPFLLQLTDSDVAQCQRPGMIALDAEIALRRFPKPGKFLGLNLLALTAAFQSALPTL